MLLNFGYYNQCWFQKKTVDLVIYNVTLSMMTLLRNLLVYSLNFRDFKIAGESCIN